jgi:hypothetical protein
MIEMNTEVMYRVVAM